MRSDVAMADFNDILSRFALEGNVLDVAPLGKGLINDTYKVTTDFGPGYVLQRINNAVFKDVELLQRNIGFVTAHIRAKLSAEGTADIDRKVLSFISLKDSDRTWWHDGASYWRVSRFIPDAVTVESVTPGSSFSAGKAFGEFESMLSDIPYAIGETIPDFHNMELRARQLSDAVAADVAGRMKSEEVRAILSEMERHMDYACTAERLHREGLLPKRICHCDTKVNNMMFDRGGDVLCVIDLDTVMPSYVFSDYGDFLRTAANVVAEDDPDIGKVAFDMDIFRAFTEGYLGAASSFLTPVEKEHLPYAASLFPFMQAVRFFTDYINGDTYYKIAYPEHNLVRTRNQMALFRSVMEHQDQMRDFILAK